MTWSRLRQEEFYTAEQVKEANRRQDVPIDVACWSHAVFNSHEVFDAMHRAEGETCDYVANEAEMLSSVSRGADSSWFDLDLSWLEFPDIDFSNFDFFDI